jgi:hypothetical protein
MPASDTPAKTLFTESVLKNREIIGMRLLSLSLTIELYKLTEAGRQLRDYSFEEGGEKEGIVTPKLFFFPPFERSSKVISNVPPSHGLSAYS